MIILKYWLNSSFAAHGSQAHFLLDITGCTEANPQMRSSRICVPWHWKKMRSESCGALNNWEPESDQNQIDVGPVMWAGWSTGVDRSIWGLDYLSKMHLGRTMPSFTWLFGKDDPSWLMWWGRPTSSIRFRQIELLSLRFWRGIQFSPNKWISVCRTHYWYRYSFLSPFLPDDCWFPMVSTILDGIHIDLPTSFLL